MNQTIESLRNDLINITKPGRYCGGEWGSIKKEISHLNTQFHMAVSFPDLYEIGMSNQALKILYNLSNKNKNIYCERVFAPDNDFEKLLKEKQQKLFTLESGTECNKLDLIGFTIGYELVMTNILNMLELSDIPICKDQRTAHDPLVIAGGPAITNPVPYGDLFDAVFIGEAEDEFLIILNDLQQIKSKGGGRNEFQARIEESPHFWTKNKMIDGIKVTRAIWNAFPDNASVFHTPVASIGTVQDHGVVEIMRGCPNKCRFCHAGVYYKPFRQKKVREVIKETDWLVYKAGFRNITLSSLSSGDYLPVLDLVKFLNERYSDFKVSFNLPSLRVNSVNLDILGELSRIRKSGLTFAVETPTENGQKGMNKEVNKEHIINLLKEAKTKGWKLAKFYFMLGMPVQNPETISDDIYDYLMSIQRIIPIQFNVNIGTFIPKPHTPFQWAPQWKESEVFNLFKNLKDRFRGTRIRMNYHSPFLSTLEGIFSRGDERIFELLIKAYKKGARFDAWDDRILKDIWREIISESGIDLNSLIYQSFPDDTAFPWDNISLGTSKKSLLREKCKAEKHEITAACDFPCREHCGQCNNGLKVIKADPIDFSLVEESEMKIHPENIVTLLGIFAKRGVSVFWGHLDILHQFEMAIQRAGYYCVMTEGYNPKPKIDYAQPLSLGFSSEYDVLSFRLYTDKDNPPREELNMIKNQINKALPEDLLINQLLAIPEKTGTGKKTKVMSLFGGSLYLLRLESEADCSRLLNQIKSAIKKNALDEYLMISKGEKTGTLNFKMISGNHKWNNPRKFIKEFNLDRELENSPEYKRIEMYCRWNNKLIRFADIK